MAEDHTALLGLSDRELKLRAGDATHQHYKGGLYRLLGFVRDADTGELLVCEKHGKERVVYEHVHPHKRELWVRDAHEFYGTVPTVDGFGPRFRRLG
jgi:hypothetical protein